MATVLQVSLSQSVVDTKQSDSSVRSLVCVQKYRRKLPKYLCQHNIKTYIHIHSNTSTANQNTHDDDVFGGADIAHTQTPITFHTGATVCEHRGVMFLGRAALRFEMDFVGNCGICLFSIDKSFQSKNNPLNKIDDLKKKIMLYFAIYSCIHPIRV